MFFVSVWDPTFFISSRNCRWKNSDFWCSWCCCHFCCCCHGCWGCCSWECWSGCENWAIVFVRWVIAIALSIAPFVWFNTFSRINTSKLPLIAHCFCCCSCCWCCCWHCWHIMSCDNIRWWGFKCNWNNWWNDDVTSLVSFFGLELLRNISITPMLCKMLFRFEILILWYYNFVSQCML